jgi:hypothetical protein
MILFPQSNSKESKQQPAAANQSNATRTFEDEIWYCSFRDTVHKLSPPYKKIKASIFYLTINHYV